MRPAKLQRACVCSIRLGILAAGATALLSLNSSMAGAEVCDADPKWLDLNKPLHVFEEPAPLRHGDQMGEDCPFYQAAWQVFLYATHPEKDDEGHWAPRFLVSSDFSTIEETFGAHYTRNFAAVKNARAKKILNLAPKLPQRRNDQSSSISAGVSQAGSFAPVIDANGNPLYFAIHFNGTIKDFFTQNHLLTAEDLKNAQEQPGFKDLEFPAGSIELKSAWQIVSDSSPPDGYFVTKAAVPWLKIVQSDGKSKIVSDPDKTDDPREVTVALVALHVVFALQDHPEFIWSTFEHFDLKTDEPDTAPSADHNPPAQPNIVANPQINYLLFKAGLEGNKIPTDQELIDNFDINKQSFTKNGNVFQTSVFRVYPASKSNTDEIDDAVKAINKSMADVVFKSSTFDPQTDKRNNYRLVGATWMNDPRGKDHADKAFTPGRRLRNIAHQDPDAGDALVTGEEHLSSTAMESFTQSDPLVMGGPNKSPNCFFCHDSAQVTDGDNVLLKDSKINVSHILSRYLLDAPSSRPAAPP